MARQDKFWIQQGTAASKFLVVCPSIQYREKISTVLDEGNAVKDFVVLVKRELGCGNS